uniref:Uncharacterized protein n=1 Tax=Schistocephalus solidus TaxID=70667 RepID=A0A0X3NZB6_SCHSO
MPPYLIELTAIFCLLGLLFVYFAVGISVNYTFRKLRGKRLVPHSRFWCGCVDSIRRCCHRLCRRGYYRNDHQLLTEDDVDEVHFIPMSQGRPEALIVPEISGASGPESQQQHTELTQKAEDDDTDDALLQF